MFAKLATLIQKYVNNLFPFLKNKNKNKKRKESGTKIPLQNVIDISKRCNVLLQHSIGFQPQR